MNTYEQPHVSDVSKLFDGPTVQRIPRSLTLSNEQLAYCREIAAQMITAYVRGESLNNYSKHSVTDQYLRVVAANFYIATAFVIPDWCGLSIDQCEKTYLANGKRYFKNINVRTNDTKYWDLIVKPSAFAPGVPHVLVKTNEFPTVRWGGWVHASELLEYGIRKEAPNGGRLPIPAYFADASQLRKNTAEDLASYLYVMS